MRFVCIILIQNKNLSEVICPTTAIKNSVEKYIVSLFLAAIQIKKRKEKKKSRAKLGKFRIRP